MKYVYVNMFDTHLYVVVRLRILRPLPPRLSYTSTIALDSSVNKVACYGLDDRNEWNAFLHLHVQTGSGFHSVAYPMPPRVQRPYRAEVKDAWSITCTLPVCLIGMVLRPKSNITMSGIKYLMIRTQLKVLPITMWT
jgi:hypothetical protein